MKKTILLASFITLAGIPIFSNAQSALTPDETHWNTILCGTWTVPDTQSNRIGTLHGSGTTRHASLFISTGGQATVSTTDYAFRTNAGGLLKTTIKQSSKGWETVSGAMHINYSDIKDSYGDLFGLSTQTTGASQKIALSGLRKGESYRIAFFFETSKGQGDGYKFNLKTSDTVASWTAVQYGYISTYNDTWNYDGNLTTGIELGGSSSYSLAAGVYAEFTYAGTDGNIVFDLMNGNLSNAKLHAFSIQTMTVPEPSAFGLLAGVGALTLVASRRRRSRS